MKKNKITILALCSSFLFSFCFTSCTDGSLNTSSSFSQKDELKLTITSTADYIGLNEYAYLTTIDQNGDEAAVDYVSSDEKIATVSSTGTVKGISFGEVTVTAISKVDSKITDSIVITVGESLTLYNVMNRLLKADSYKTTYTGRFTYGYTNYSFNNVEEVNSDTYYFDAIDENDWFKDVGYASRNYETFEFSKTGDEVSNAIYLRNYYENYSDFIYLAKELSGNYYSLMPDEDGLYNLKNGVDTSLFLNLVFQNADMPTNFNLTNVLNDITGLTAEVLAADSFKIDIHFDRGVYTSNGYITLIFSDFNDVDLSYVDEYLKNNQIAVPATDDKILRIRELIADYNYISNLGTSIVYDENGDISSTIPIGDLQFTKDYLYFNYSDEYLQQNQDLVRGGYINLSDGVYTFLVDDAQNITLDSKWNYVDEEGNLYTRYQDYYPNITLVMDIIAEENKLYSFVSDATSMFDGSEFKSDSYVSLNIAAQLDGDAVEAGGTPYALYVGLKDSSVDEEAIVGIGSSFQFVDMGGVVIPPIYKTYTDFGKANVDFIDTYLASL